MQTTAPRPHILTIGHSNHETGDFLALLARHGVRTLVDVRSWPGSRRLPQFNKATLETALQGANIAYEWRGEALGGKAEDPALLGPDGKPDYPAMAARPQFQDALNDLIAEARETALAIMCAEGDPARCHRTLLVGAALASRGVEITHILRDGTMAADHDLPGRAPPAQGELFG